LFSTASRADEPSLALHLRSRVKVDGRDDFAVKQVTGAWPAKEAALFICDRLESRGDDNAT
jgi:hypothetical protein